MQRKQTECVHKIMPQIGIDSLRILLSLKLLVIDADKFFAPPRALSKAIICDPIKPRGKTRFTTKAADVFVSSKESLLREGIGECGISSGEMAQHAAHTRVIP